MIRETKESDFESIKVLMQYGVKTGSVKERTDQDLKDNLDTFVVYEQENHIVACVCLNLYTEITYDFKDSKITKKNKPIRFAEIRSLIVLPNYQNQGIARELIEECYQTCKQLGVYEVFATTDKVKLFEDMGFREEISGQKALFLKIY